jgi:hypothetical protein
MIGVTLFAVIPCGYVGWQAKIVRDRKTLLNSLVRGDGFALPQTAGSVSWFRRALGDLPIEIIVLKPGSSKDDRDKLRSAFPEARLLEDHSPDLLEFPESRQQHQS